MNRLITRRILQSLSSDPGAIEAAVEALVASTLKPSAAALFVFPLGEGVYSVPGDDGRLYQVTILSGRTLCQSEGVQCCDTDESPACWHYRAVQEWLDGREFER